MIRFGGHTAAEFVFWLIALLPINYLPSLFYVVSAYFLFDISSLVRYALSQRAKVNMAIIKESFFETWSPSLAWWLGLLYGDGCISQTESSNVICLGMRAGGVVRKWRDMFVASTGDDFITVKPTKDGGSFFDCHVNSKMLVLYIKNRWGICGPKSHSLVWPYDLPIELEKYFIRGLIDTDGSLSIDTRMSEFARGFKNPILGYASACEDFIHLVLQKICNAIGSDKISVSRREKDGSEWFQFTISGKNALLAANWIYSDNLDLASERRLDKLVELNRCAERPVCSCGAIATSNGLCRKCSIESIRGAKPPCPLCERLMGRGATECTTCRRRLRRRAGVSSYQPKPVGTCACGKEAFREGNRCHACYARDRREEMRKMARVAADAGIEPEYAKDPAYMAAYKEALPAAPCTVCGSPSVVHNLCRSCNKKQYKRNLTEKMHLLGKEDALSGKEPSYPKNTAYMSSYKDSLPKSVCSKCGNNPISVRDVCGECARKESKLAYYYRSKSEQVGKTQ